MLSLLLLLETGMGAGVEGVLSFNLYYYSTPISVQCDYIKIRHFCTVGTAISCSFKSDVQPVAKRDTSAPISICHNMLRCLRPFDVKW